MQFKQMFVTAVCVLFLYNKYLVSLVCTVSYGSLSSSSSICGPIVRQFSHKIELENDDRK